MYRFVAMFVAMLFIQMYHRYPQGAQILPFLQNLKRLKCTASILPLRMYVTLLVRKSQSKYSCD